MAKAESAPQAGLAKAATEKATPTDAPRSREGARSGFVSRLSHSGRQRTPGEPDGHLSPQHVNRTRRFDSGTAKLHRWSADSGLTHQS